MKTAVIYNTCEAELVYFIVDGDKSHLNGTYINSVQSNPKLESELADLLYDREGELMLEPVTLEQFTQAVRNGASVIAIGFIP